MAVSFFEFDIADLDAVGVNEFIGPITVTTPDGNSFAHDITMDSTFGTGTRYANLDPSNGVDPDSIEATGAVSCDNGSRDPRCQVLVRIPYAVTKVILEHGRFSGIQTAAATVSACELPPTTEFCGNGTDDDLDGFVDCIDPDCDADAACIASGVSSCSDEFYWFDNAPDVGRLATLQHALGGAITISEVGDTNFNINNTCYNSCLLYTSPSPRDATLSRMPSSA